MRKTKFLLTLPLLTALAATATAIEVGPLEAVTEFTDYRGGGITITPAGRILVSMHPLDNPKIKVVEIMANGSKQQTLTGPTAPQPEQSVYRQLLEFIPIVTVLFGY